MAPHASFDSNDTSRYTPRYVEYRKSSEVYSIPTVNTKGLCERSESPCLIYRLSKRDIRSIEASLDIFEGLDLPLSSISPKTFPLNKNLRARLREVVENLYEGPKFQILSGIDPTRYTAWQNTAIHAGVACHIGSSRGMAGSLGGDKTVLQHITAIDAGSQPDGSYNGPPNQLRDIPLHTDNGDIVSLYAMSTSASGGRFFLARAAEAYEHMRKWNFQLAEELTRDWTIINPSPDVAFDIRPLVFLQENSGKVLINCSRARITGTPSDPRPASLPAITDKQMLALDTLHAVAMAHATAVSLNAGDMIFFNNLEMLHGREAFRDDVERGHKRHLLRLILRNDERALQLPPQLRDTWSSLYDHDVADEIFPIVERPFTRACSH